jgi:putative transposase
VPSSGRPTPTHYADAGRARDKWHVDEVFITISGQRRYLWRAVDQHGTVLDILVTSRRDTAGRDQVLS